MDADSTAADEAAKQYDAAEADFLTAVARRAPREELAGVAALVRDLAHTWQMEAWGFYWDVRNNDKTDRRVNAADNTAEVAEAMADLWADIARAYGADPPANAINYSSEST